MEDVFPCPIDQSNLSAAPLTFVQPHNGGLVSSNEHSTGKEEKRKRLISGEHFRDIIPKTLFLLSCYKKRTKDEFEI